MISSGSSINVFSAKPIVLSIKLVTSVSLTKYITLAASSKLLL